MKYNRKEALEIFKEFTDICKKNDIWYSAIDHTLLGLQRHGGFVPWVEKLQVVMTPSSYRKLLRLYPKKVIDSSIIDNYKSLQAAFIKDSAKWKEGPFIEIFLVVPTTLKKIKKWKCPIRSTFNCLMMKKSDLRNSIDALIDESNNEGFYIIDKKFGKVLENWLPKLSFKVETKKFNNIDINVMVEYKDYLTNKFGPNYMEVSIPKVQYSYPYPGAKVKEQG